MKRRELILIAGLLVVTSAALYTVHYAIFHDVHHIFIYLLGDIAFLPLEVLLVTIIIDRLLSVREKRNRQHKLNMVIGSFFSAVGEKLLRVMADMTTDQPEIAAQAALDPTWTEAEIRKAINWSQSRKFSVVPTPETLGKVRGLLGNEREFMLRLLENPMLMEHEAFSDLLWAVFHLGEELTMRKRFNACSPPDLEHLSVDAERAYTHLLTQWLEYMIHLKRDYPFLFSLAARTNPLREGAEAEIE